MSPLFFNNNALSRNFSETHFFEENIFGTRKMVLIVSFCSVSIFFLLFIFLVYRVSLAGPRDGIYIEHFYKYISRRYDIQSYSRRKQMFRRDENEKRKKKKKERVDIIRVKSDALFYSNMLWNKMLKRFNGDKFFFAGARTYSARTHFIPLTSTSVWQVPNARW